LPDDATGDLTDEQARHVAACAGQGDDAWETTPIVIALMETFPRHDWLSLAPCQGGQSEMSFRDLLHEVYDPSGPWSMGTMDPWQGLKDGLLKAEQRRLRRQSVSSAEPGQPREDT
jgi:hypothetical protein